MDTLKVKLRREWTRLRNDHDYWEVLKGSGITFLLRVCSFLLIYLINLFIAKEYGALELGIYTISLTILNIGLVLVTLGTDTAIVRWISEYRSQDDSELVKQIFNKIIRLTLLVSIIFSLCFYLFSEQIVHALFAEERLTQPVKIVSFLLPFALMARLYASGFRGLKQVRQSITYDVLGTRIGNFVFLLLLVLILPKDLMNTLYALAIATILNTCLAAIDWHTNLKKWEKRAQPSRKAEGSTSLSLKKILNLSLPMYLTSSMILIMDWTDTLMLGVLAGTEVVGVYSAVLKLSLITSFALASINTIILPKFSEMYWSNDAVGLQKIVHFSNRLTFWTSVPLIVVIAVFSEPLLSLFGGQFLLGTSSLVILCIGQFVNSATGSVISLLNMTGHQKKSRNILVMSALLNLYGNYLLIPVLGMVGAAIATSISMISRDVIATYWANQLLGFRTWYIPGFSTLFQSQTSKPLGGKHNEG